MFRFRVGVAGEIQMDRGIERFADGLTDYRPIWGVIEDDFYAQVQAQFKSEGAAGGEKWQELSAEYAGWKEMRYPGKPILERTGNLVKSLTSGSDPNAVKREERKTLTLGSAVSYAIYHQSPLARKRLPRRPEIMLTEKFKKEVMRHLQVYVVRMATQGGFRIGWNPGVAEAIVSAAHYGKPRTASLHGFPVKRGF